MSTTEPGTGPAHLMGSSPIAANEPHLRGNLGTPQLVFTLLAFNGPLGVVAAVVPAVIAFGNGIGAPVAFMAGALIVAAFSVGFIAMAERMKSPSGFYSFVSAGLGRELGLGASFLAIACYYVVLGACYCLCGIGMQSIVRDTFHGPDVTWWVWALGAQAIVAVLGYFQLELSARVLTVLLLAEILVTLVYDFFVVINGGHDGLSADSFLPSNATSGSIGLALLFGVLCMGGFEATVVFREEVKNPATTIPRATYAFIATVAVFYGLAAWALIQAFGEDHVVEAAAADPAGSFFDSARLYLGVAGLDVVFVLIATSQFAAALACHNILSRYVFNLARQGVFPPGLSVSHPAFGSPYRASLVTTLFVLAGFAVLPSLTASPEFIYAQLVGGFGYALLMLLLMTNIAILVHLNRPEHREVHIMRRVVVPVLSFAGLAITLVLATTNIEAIFTAGHLFTVCAVGILYALVVAGVVYALFLRRVRPEVYRAVGGDL